MGGLSLHASPNTSQVPLAEYVPKAMELLQAKAVAAAEVQAEKGREFLQEAAKEEGAVQTDSGLVVKTITEGTGSSPTAAETVQVREYIEEETNGRGS